MATIEERRRLLDDKLKEMAEDGVMKRNPKETIAFDPPEEEEEPPAEIRVQPKEQSPEAKPPLQRKTEEAPITLDDYRFTYSRSETSPPKENRRSTDHARRLSFHLYASRPHS